MRKQIQTLLLFLLAFSPLSAYDGCCEQSSYLSTAATVLSVASWIGVGYASGRAASCRSSKGADGGSGVPGPEGAKGSQGLSGPQGCQGIAGPAGDPGPMGIDGLQGPVGPQGFPGANAANGANGTSGTNGCDGHDGIDGFPLSLNTTDALQILFLQNLIPMANSFRVLLVNPIGGILFEQTIDSSTPTASPLIVFPSGFPLLEGQYALAIISDQGIMAGVGTFDITLPNGVFEFNVPPQSWTLGEELVIHFEFES